MSLRKTLPVAALAVLALVFVAFAGASKKATTTNLVVTPTTPVFDANNVVGVPDDHAPGFPSGSLASDGSGKTDMYFTPEVLFGRSVTLGEIASISYWTKKDQTHAVDPRDWFLAIYTKPYSGDVSTPGWYGDRIGSEPYFSINLNDPANTWNRWKTGGSENRLRFFESTEGAPGATFGSYTDPDWATFVSGNALSGQPYATREVLFFSVQTGSAWANGFTGQLDGLKITLSDGSVAKVNFEAPPKPTLDFGPQLAASACGPGTLVVNVEQKVRNDADSGVAGNAWAFDDYERHIKVWQTGSSPDTFCATVSYEGKFTTNAGASPGNTGTVEAGVRGRFEGGYRTTQFTGTFSPTEPTHGNLGVFDYRCDISFNCPGYVPWTTFYFTSTSGFDLAWWGWIYHAGKNGTWVNAISGNAGDITGGP